MSNRLARIATIAQVVIKYRLDSVASSLLGAHAPRWLKLLSFLPPPTQSEAVRLKEALVELGPIFVKLGQTLSTRRDMLPEDVANELAQLQDRVPPFPSAQAIAIVTRAYNKPPEQVFAQFDTEPTASASIAQVHFATLVTGESVAVKVLRPGILAQIEQDLALMKLAARWVAGHSADGRRLRPIEIVQEFDTVLHNELDLVLEAANATQLRQNFPPNTHRGSLLYVPQVYWDYCRKEVLVTERIYGIPINRFDELTAAGIDFKKLSRDGVEIFFTQVFTDGYFHADMHPGNILVGTRGTQFNQYLALDFGIMGTLSDTDKHYLAHNFLAFFRRDYKAVAQLHIDSGWVPATTRVDELAMAVRACCEPFFNKPIKDISLGLVLLRLFDASRRFNVEIQPQLVLLQKTLLNTEGLGRSLDPELDLWQTAQPILERWMKEQLGIKGLTRRIRAEAPKWAELLPELPRLLHSKLSEKPANPAAQEHARQQLEALSRQNRSLRRWVFGLGLLMFATLASVLMLAYVLYHALHAFGESM